MLLSPNSPGQRWATGWMVRCSGADKGWQLFSSPPRPDQLGPNQPPTQWVPRVLSLELKQPKRVADHSPPSNAEVKHACVELYLHNSNTPSWRGAQLMNRQNTTISLTQYSR